MEKGPKIFRALSEIDVCARLRLQGGRKFNRLELNSDERSILPRLSRTYILSTETNVQ